jgi:hypothetical protein
MSVHKKLPRVGTSSNRVCYPWDIFISIKVSPILCFQNSKVWISAFQEDRKVLAFDLTMLHYVQNSQSPITPINYVYTVISAWNSMITPAVKWFLKGDIMTMI